MKRKQENHDQVIVNYAFEKLIFFHRHSTIDYILTVDNVWIFCY